MTLEKLNKELKKVCRNVAYLRFKQATSPPFIIYGLAGSSDVHADNRHYFKIDDGFVELYSDDKMPEVERKIEKAFSDNQIPWEKEYEEYIESQRMMCVRWSIQLLGG